MKRYFWLIGLLLALLIPVTSAQSDDLLAFLNGSGQLVVSSGDGATRWIVTNPGQTIDKSLGFAWTDDGQLVFALTNVGIFAGDPETQAIAAVDADSLEVRSYLRGFSHRPNSTQPQGLSADGQFAFVANNGGYVIVGNNTQLALPLSGDNNAQGSGLWSDIAPEVAYWGVDSNNRTALSVVHAPSQNSITLPSGGSVPMLPIAWLPDATALFYRSATGEVMFTDVACVAANCADNPLENGVIFAPSSANQFQVTDSNAYYVDGEQLISVDLTCGTANTCLESRQVLDDKVVPLSMMHVSNDRLVYTTYNSDPNSNSDRTVLLIDLTCSPDCAPQPILNGAMAGLLSTSGNYVMVDGVDIGINILDISRGGSVYLTETMGGQLGAGLATARWQ